MNGELASIICRILPPRVRARGEILARTPEREVRSQRREATSGDGGAKRGWSGRSRDSAGSVRQAPARAEAPGERRSSSPATDTRLPRRARSGGWRGRLDTTAENTDRRKSHIVPGPPRVTPAHKSLTKGPTDAMARRSRPRRLRLRDGSFPGVLATCEERENRGKETTEGRTMRAVSRIGRGADAPARPLSGNRLRLRNTFQGPSAPKTPAHRPFGDTWVWMVIENGTSSTIR